MPTSIDICIATYKRPELLANLLKSLTLQSVRETTALRIIVIDNDAARSAEQTVEDFRASSGMETVYDVESRQGISYARNRALRHAGAPLIAFIDDDEEASSAWVDSLSRTLEQYQADVVFGPVVARFPAAAPAWALSQPCFQRPRRPTGARVEHGATGNVLMKASLFAGCVEPFDLAYARTGGEDTKFFKGLHEAGCVMVWCDDALVFETVPSERLTLRWVLARAFRGGQTYYRIFLAERPLSVRLLWLAQRVAGVLAGLVILPLLMIKSLASAVRWLARIVGWLGQLSQALGRFFEYEEYRGGSRD